MTDAELRRTQMKIVKAMEEYYRWWCGPDGPPGEANYPDKTMIGVQIGMENAIRFVRDLKWRKGKE